MGGSDTSRGINFQYACAIEIILECTANPAWNMIQLEGSVDVEDVVVFDQAGQVLVRTQIKQKNDPYQWQPAEIAAVVRAFSNCRDFEETRYQFVYAGSEGATFVREIKPILIKLRVEGAGALYPWEKAKLEKYFAPESVIFLLKAGHRLEFIKHDTRGSLKDKSLLRIRRMCASQVYGHLANDFEEQVYARLFHLVANVTEQTEQYARCLKRTEILEALKGDAVNQRHEQGYGSGTFSAPLYSALPRPPDNFVGRLDILNSLKYAVSAGASWVAVYGLPGVGKTSVVRALVEDKKVQELYSDGILWGALGRNSDPLTVLGTWAVELGMQQEELQAFSTIEARVQAVRREIGMRRMLLIVDDVWELSDALAVGVGGPNCIHLATTRLPVLAQDLSVTQAFKLDEFDESECIDLFTKLAPQVIRDQREQVYELIHLVGGLPLAVSLMGKYLRRQGNHSRRLEAALNRLRDIRERLGIDQLQSSIDRHPSIPLNVPLSLLTAIQISVDVLDKGTRKAFYSLSILPAKPSSFTEGLALAVMSKAADTLDILYDSGLIEIVPSDRYTLHQVISDFGRLHYTNPIAKRRMINFCLEYVEKHQADFDSLDHEVDNIFAAFQHAKDLSLDEVYAHLVNESYRFLETRGLYHLVAPHLQQAFLAARRTGESREQGFALYHMGRTALRLGKPAEAVQHFYRALDIETKCEDIYSCLNTIGNLSAALMELNEIEEAGKWAMHGLSFARKLGDQEIIIGMLNTAGGLAVKQGDNATGEKYFQEALQRVKFLPSYTGLSPLLTNMAVTIAHNSRYQEAEIYLQAALTNAEANHHHEYVLLALIDMISINLDQGKFEVAEGYLQRVLPLTATTPYALHSRPLAMCLLTIARNCKDTDRIREYLSIALTLAKSLNNDTFVIRILSEMGTVLTTQDNFREALTAFEEALVIAVSSSLHEWSIHLLVSLGIVKANQRDYEGAERCFSASLALAKEQGYKDKVFMTLLHLARLAISEDNFDRAQPLFEQSVDQALIDGNIDDALAVLGEVGEVALIYSKPLIAKHYWRRALTLARQQESPQYISVALIRLGNISLQEQRFVEAEEVFRDAAYLAEEKDLIDLAVVALYSLIRSHLSQGRVEDARVVSIHCFRLLEQLDSAEVNNFKQNLLDLLRQNGIELQQFS